MPKLVVLSEGMTGQSYELKVDKTTVGRVEDNTFQIADPSVSSHHCEVLLRGSDIVIKDLNSTNGTFLNGEKVSETVVKPGQTLRLGQIEVAVLNEGMPIPAPSAAPGASAPPAPAPNPAAPFRKPVDHTMVIQRGVSLDALSEGSRPGFDTSRGFSKK